MSGKRGRAGDTELANVCAEALTEDNRHRLALEQRLSVALEEEVRFTHEAQVQRVHWADGSYYLRKRVRRKRRAVRTRQRRYLKRRRCTTTAVCDFVSPC